jgi:hypothetical protein
MEALTLPPVASAPTATTMGVPPNLGAQVPGGTGGLPTLGGLSVTANPMARQLQSAGRGGDSMLVHMTPGEVSSLRGLAQRFGGDLSVNPQTGLPEAGFLSRILPTLLGVGLAATGVGAPLAAGLVGLGTTAATGDISKGLMAGLGAFGGAGLAGAAGLGGSVAGGNAFGLLGDSGGLFGANMGTGAAAAGAGAGAAVPEITTQAASEAATRAAQQGVAQQVAKTAGTSMQGFPELVQQAATQGAQQAGTLGANQAINLGAQGLQTTTATAPATPGFFERFGEHTRIPGAPKLVNDYLPYAAGYAAVAPALTSTGTGFPEEEEEDYTIPRYRTRNVAPRIPEGPAYRREGYQGELQFFDPAGPQRMAEGDEVPMPRDEIAPAPGGLGSLGASLPDFARMFQTSPGAVTGVPFGYGPGQSPTELIRAQVEAMPTPATPAMGGEADYGFMKSAPRADPMGAYGGAQMSPDMFPYLKYLGLNTGFGYAKGGTIEMESGGFVMPARETAEFGNGSTDAGQRRLGAMGGVPIRGSGDGVSDSIPARIDGKQQARLADGETYFPPRTVERMGGVAKLRGMMQAAEKSRKQASRGGGNKIRGLA